MSGRLKFLKSFGGQLGELEVTVHSAHNLLGTDVLSAHDLLSAQGPKTSDPYCILTLKEHASSSKASKRAPVSTAQTTIKMAELNPDYEETFKLMVNSENMFLECVVNDYNAIATDTFLGCVEVGLNHFFTHQSPKPIVKQSFRLMPNKKNSQAYVTGDIILSVNFHPIARALLTVIVEEARAVAARPGYTLHALGKVPGHEEKTQNSRITNGAVQWGHTFMLEFDEGLLSRGGTLDVELIEEAAKSLFAPKPKTVGTVSIPLRACQEAQAGHNASIASGVMPAVNMLRQWHKVADSEGGEAELFLIIQYEGPSLVKAKEEQQKKVTESKEKLAAEKERLAKAEAETRAIMEAERVAKLAREQEQLERVEAEEKARLKREEAEEKARLEREEAEAELERLTQEGLLRSASLDAAAAVQAQLALEEEETLAAEAAQLAAAEQERRLMEEREMQEEKESRRKSMEMTELAITTAIEMERRLKEEEERLNAEEKKWLEAAALEKIASEISANALVLAAEEEARLEREEAERKEAEERLAKEKEEENRKLVFAAAALERERQEKEAADRLAKEQAQLEQDEANRIAAVEQARLAQEEADRLAAEQARIEKEEQDRLAKQEAAEKQKWLAKKEQDRKDAEAAIAAAAAAVAAELEEKRMLEEAEKLAAEREQVEIEEAQRRSAEAAAIAAFEKAKSDAEDAQREALIVQALAEKEQLEKEAAEREAAEQRSLSKGLVLAMPSPSKNMDKDGGLNLLRWAGAILACSLVEGTAWHYQISNAFHVHMTAGVAGICAFLFAGQRKKKKAKAIKSPVKVKSPRATRELDFSNVVFQPPAPSPVPIPSPVQSPQQPEAPTCTVEDVIAKIEAYRRSKRYRLTDLFHEMDKAKNGFLRRSELIKFLGRAIPEISAEQVTLFKEFVDTDWNGKVSYKELGDAMNASKYRGNKQKTAPYFGPSARLTDTSPGPAPSTTPTSGRSKISSSRTWISPSSGATTLQLRRKI